MLPHSISLLILRPDDITISWVIMPPASFSKTLISQWTIKSQNWLKSYGTNRIWNRLHWKPAETETIWVKYEALGMEETKIMNEQITQCRTQLSTSSSSTFPSETPISNPFSGVIFQFFQVKVEFESCQKADSTLHTLLHSIIQIFTFLYIQQ